MPLSVARGLSRSERDRTIAFFIFGLSLALFVFSHARGFSIAALSDDIGLIRLFAQHAESGGLGAEIFERLVGPTARAANVSTTMWRPLPFASFGLDALLHGDGVTR
jgi:hypothetical protein